MCQYRAVGHPIAVHGDRGAGRSRGRARSGWIPAELRRRNLIADDAYPSTAASGIRFEKLSHQRSLERAAGDDGLRRRCARSRPRCARAASIAASGSRPSSRSPIRRRRSTASAARASPRRTAARCGSNPQGGVIAAIGVTEQGQGTEAIIAQIVATAIGVPHRRTCASSPATPTPRPMAAAPGPGAAPASAARRRWQAGKALRQNILEVGGRHAAGRRRERSTSATAASSMPPSGAERMALEEFGRIAYFRPDTLPPASQPELMVTRHYVPKDYPFAFTNGMQALLRRGRHRDRLRQAAQALVRRGLRHGPQPAARRRADPRRHRAGHRRRAVRGVPLRQPRARC